MTVSPSAMATPKNPTPSGLPSPLPGKTAENVAVPTRPKTSRKVPTVSAINLARVDGSAGAGASGYDMWLPHKKRHRSDEACCDALARVKRNVQKKHTV